MHGEIGQDFIVPKYFSDIGYGFQSKYGMSCFFSPVVLIVACALLSPGLGCIILRGEMQCKDQWASREMPIMLGYD
jgi:hypothetical protein